MTGFPEPLGSILFFLSFLFLAGVVILFIGMFPKVYEKRPRLIYWGSLLAFFAIIAAGCASYFLGVRG